MRGGWLTTPRPCRFKNNPPPLRERPGSHCTFERVEEFKYLGTTLTIHNSIRVEIKSRLRSGNACYHSVQNLLSSRLLSRKLKIKIYRTMILPVVLYGCEAWSLTLREERKLRLFENMALRRIFGPRRDEVTEK